MLTRDHGAQILERIDLIGQILFGVLRPCKGLLYEGEKLGRHGQVPGTRAQSRSSSRPSREESIPLKFCKFCLLLILCHKLFIINRESES